MKTESFQGRRFKSGLSRLGGLPDLPLLAPWPECDSGLLGFCGQIQLSDLAGSTATSVLPSEGLLSIFVYQSCETGEQPGNNDVAENTQLLYTSPEEELVRHSVPDDLVGEGNAPRNPLRLSFHEVWDLPNLNSEETPSELKSVIDRLQEMNPDCYPREIVSRANPFGFSYHHLLGFSTHGRCSFDPSPGPEWIHILQLGSEPALNWSWCDGQSLSIWVHQDDIADRTFRRVFGYAA